MIYTRRVTLQVSVSQSVSFFVILSNLRNHTIEAFLYPQLLRKGMLGLSRGVKHLKGCSLDPIQYEIGCRFSCLALKLVEMLCTF